MIIFDLQKPSKCCPNSVVTVRRHIMESERAPQQGSVLFSLKATNPEVITFKALSQVHGTRFKYEVKRVGLIGSSGKLGQTLQAAGSYALPGDLSPLRSPVRSGVFTALTPGVPNISRPRMPGRDRTARCPEGYQYGGRFTDNELSTCGAQLFDIPGPLGAAIGVLARALRRGERAVADAIQGTPLTPGEYGDSIIDSRRPQIPRVADANPTERLAQVARLAKEMGAPKINAARMVRRDGFVLEPVVTPKVLRAIPDNRDMEGATYLMRINDLPSLGQDELGLLSNTGVTNLTYILPGGSTISLEKVRSLTVGERRKLGRTVNAAAAIDNSENPTARLMRVVEETGDGIKYSENFVGVNRPHEIIKGRNGKKTERWVRELLDGIPVTESTPSRETSSVAAIADKIKDIDEAAALIEQGGSLARISPEILQQALTKNNLFRLRDMGNGVQRLDGPKNRVYSIHQSRGEFDHINSTYASDIQQHLGLESPDIYPIGTGTRRNYLMDSTMNTYPGVTPRRDIPMNQVSPKKMAALFVSDHMSGNQNRNPLSIEVMQLADENVPVVNSFDSELTDLAKIKIADRNRIAIDEMRSLGPNGVYGKYYAELKKEQRRQFINEIRALIARARLFNFVNFKERIQRDGLLSDAELAHVDIVNTISKQRLNILENQQERLVEILGGNK